MVKVCTPADDAAWDAYVRKSPTATCYHQSSWRRVIESCFGHQTCYLMATDSTGATVGVLPLARVRSRMFGDFLVSLPFVNYGGCCADSEVVEGELERAAVELAREEGVAHLELRTTTASQTTGLTMRASKASMRLPLPADPDELWQKIGSKLRNQIKRPEREGVTIRFGREDQLDAFYDVFAVNMRDLGTPVYTKRLFQSVLRELPDSSWIGAVYLGRTPVAAGFLVGFKDMVEVPWASSLRSYNSIGANVFLYWNLLRFSCERGYATFDFGRSTPDSGPFRFKRQWGASPLPLNWRYWVPAGGSLPQLNPQNPRYQMAVRMWQRLPVPVTRLIGPAIVRNIP